MKNLYKRVRKPGILILLVLFCSGATMQQSLAQLNPLKSFYFQNQYLLNPAMAGLSDGLKVNLHYRKQFNSIPGAPITMAVTGDYRLGNSGGVGVNVYQDEEGILKRTKAMATYAYHLPLSSKGSALHIGLSAGVINEKIDMNDILGDIDDVEVMKYNDRGPYFEADFGIAYTDSKFTIQASLPNIRGTFDSKINKSETINRATFLGAASYKLLFNEGAVGIEPKVVYRGVKGTDDVIDAGANVSFANEQFNLFGMYHSTKNTTFGLDINITPKVKVFGNYTTKGKELSRYTDGSFELGLQTSLWHK